MVAHGIRLRSSISSKTSSPSWGILGSSHWRHLWGTPCPLCGWHRAAAERSAGPAFHVALRRRQIRKPVMYINVYRWSTAKFPAAWTVCVEHLCQLVSPAPAVRTGMASFMGQWGEERKPGMGRQREIIANASMHFHTDVYWCFLFLG